jgi:exodeoxyribonuclease VII large subunit
VEGARHDLSVAFRRRVEYFEKRLEHDRTLLENMSPLAVLRRGYAIARTIPDGRIVRNAESVAVGDKLEIDLSSGRLVAEVRKIYQT